MVNFKTFYDAYKNPDVSKRDYDEAIAALSQRAANVWRYICKQSARGVGEDLTSSIGPDTVVMHGDWTEFYAEYLTDEKFDAQGENKHYKYDNSFPTELLWDNNWQSTVDAHIQYAVTTFVKERQDKLARNKEKREAKKIRDKQKQLQQRVLFDSVIQKTKATLTDEEYAWLFSKLERP